MNKYILILAIFCTALFTSCGDKDYEPEPPQSVEPDQPGNNISNFLSDQGLKCPYVDDIEQILGLYKYRNEKMLLAKVKNETLCIGKYGNAGNLIFVEEWNFADSEYPYLKHPSIVGYIDNDGSHTIHDDDFFMNGKLLFAIPYANYKTNEDGSISRAAELCEKYRFCGLDWERGKRVWDGTDCPYINSPQFFGSYDFKKFGDYALLTPGKGKTNIEHLYCLKSDGSLLWHRDASEDENRNGLDTYNEAWFINDTEIVWYTYYSDYYTRGLRIINLKDYELVNKIYLRPYDSAGILMGDYDGPNKTCGDVVNVSFADGMLLVDFDFYESYYIQNEVTGGTNYVKNMLGQYRLTMTYPDGEVISKEKLKDY